VFGTAVFTERLLAEILSDPLTASPFLFAESVANAPAAQAAIALLAQGPNITVCQREASGVHAVGQAVSALRSGQAKAMLAGELDEASPLLHAALDRYGALASPRGDLSEAARPFDRRRNGMLMAEGSTILLLETAAAAAARGASLRARVAAVGGAFDATATTTNWGHGAAALAAGLRRTLDRAGCNPEAVDVVVSGAGGSVRGDRLEAALLHAVWQGRALPPVVAPKSVTGDYGGGLLASALLALAGSPVTRRPDFEPDPELDLVPWSGPLPHPPRTVLVTATAAGGAAGWLLLTAP
jgi:3-oxoacyl-[acyl-carrier-protein] synthase II